MYDTEITERTPAAKMAEVRELIKRVRLDPRATNKPVLAVNMIEAQRAKNGGYPMHMYHQTLEAVCDVGSTEEEEALAALGYGRHYIAQSHPCWLYRRNMDPKFQADGLIEALVVQTREQEDTLKKRVPMKGCGKWCNRIIDIEPLPDGPEEDPAVTIARLEGQLSEARTTAEKRSKKGEA